MAGTVIVDTINSSVAGTPPVFQAGGTQIGTLCRAWVNFNGTGTVAIRASFNVSSITDNGTGDYTVNFTTAMPDANYSWGGMCQYNNAGSPTAQGIVFKMNDGANFVTSSLLRVNTGTASGTSYDCAIVAVQVFR